MIGFRHYAAMYAAMLAYATPPLFGVILFSHADRAMALFIIKICAAIAVDARRAFYA